MNSSPRSTHSSRRHRRAGRAVNLAGSIPAIPSPLRVSEAGPGPTTAGTRRRALARESEEMHSHYVSPTDRPTISTRIPPDTLDYDESSEDGESVYESVSSREVSTSPVEHNPPTPNLLDISLHSLRGHSGHSFGGRRESTGLRPAQGSGSGSGDSDETAAPPSDRLIPPTGDASPPPPSYAAIDPVMYAGKSFPGHVMQCRVDLCQLDCPQIYRTIWSWPRSQPMMESPGWKRGPNEQLHPRLCLVTVRVYAGGFRSRGEGHDHV
jgi:hypothetical protein